MPLQINLIFAIILGGGWIFGRLFAKIKLPSILGMVIFGILCSLFIKDYTPTMVWELTPFLKSFALIIILLRAGLSIKRDTLKKVGNTALLMSFIPCVMEGIILMILLRIFFHFEWTTAGLTGFMLSAVSPAVVVPSMLNFKEKGYGKKNDVPTILIAGGSLDNVASITLFSVLLSIIKKDHTNIFQTIFAIPVSVIIGIISGIIIGFILSLFFKLKHTSVRATEKTLVVLVCGALLVQVGDIFHFTSLLGIMTAGFILLEKHETIAHELSIKFAKLWIFAEIILFVLIGFSLDISVALQAGLKGLWIISIGLFVRSIGVLIATAFSKLSIKERLFCVIAYLPKATVQAALGGVALSNGMPEGKLILAIAVVSILFTSPLGLFGINLLGPRLLTKVNE